MCGPRTYSVLVKTVSTPATTQFVSVIDSPTTSTLVKPILSAFTTLDTDILNPYGYHEVELSFHFTRYYNPSSSDPNDYYKAKETFYVEV